MTATDAVIANPSGLEIPLGKVYLVGPLVAPLADRLLVIVGRQHGGTVSRCNPGS